MLQNFDNKIYFIRIDKYNNNNIMKNTHQGPYVRYISGTKQLNQLFQENQFVIIHFYATWYSRTQFLQCVLIPAAEKHETFILAIVDCYDDHNQELKKKFKICALPASYLFQKNIGSIISYFVGDEQTKLYQMIKKIDTLNEYHQGPYVRQISGVEQLTQLFYENQLIVVNFWTIESPSCKYLKIQLIKSAQQHKTFILACVDCNDASNQALKKKFNITFIPAVFLLFNNIDTIHMNFIGKNIQLVEYLLKKIKEIDMKKAELNQNEKTFKCQTGGHELFSTIKQNLPYYNGRFTCNICKSREKASNENLILHCDKCNYDVCHNCRQNPLILNNQNDKTFKCQTGHELLLTIKQNLPYYDGRFTCNICKIREKASNKNPILHCDKCNYDICYNCRKNPLLNNQNDKTFKCQMGGHDLFLRIKHLPYYNGRFICNICKYLQKVSHKNPILHCDKCNYNVCYYCRQYPCARKLFNCSQGTELVITEIMFMIVSLFII